MQDKMKDYTTTSTMAKSGVELVVMVYDGAMKHLRLAAEHYRLNDFNAGFDAMQQVRKFVVHLYTTLDMEKGGEISTNLSKLYAFMVEQINVIQATKDVARIEQVIGIMNNLREGWLQLANKTKDPTGDKPADGAPERPSRGLSLSI